MVSVPSAVEAITSSPKESNDHTLGSNTIPAAIVLAVPHVDNA